MQSGSITDQPPIELFCSFVAQRANGVLELAEGKKKRAFYFEDGRLTYTRSNLKSESLGRLQELHPDTPEEELLVLQGEMRVLRGFTLAEGEWAFKPNTAPPKRQPVQLVALAWRMVQEKLPQARVDSRLAGLRRRFPRLASSRLLEEIPLDPPTRGLIADLDGTRTLEDVLSFAPVEPKIASRVLYVALITGAVDFEEDVADEISASPTNPGSLDLSDLIASSVESSPEPTAPEPDAEPEPPGEDVQLVKLRKQNERIEGSEDHFQVLGVHWDLAEGEMRKAYFKLAHELHPDRWTSYPSEVQDLAQHVFTRIGEAWEILGDAEKRKAYTDRTVHGIKSEDELAMEKVQAILAAEDVFKQGLALYNRGKISVAHDKFKEAHEMVPEEAEFMAYFGYTTWKLNVGRDDLAANDGRQMVDKAVEAHVKLDGGVVLQGLIAKQQSKRQAAAFFKKALEMNPNNPDAEREIKRLQQELLREKAKKKEEKKGFFGKLFGKK